MKKIIIAVSVVPVITVIACAGMIGYHNKYYSISVGIGAPTDGMKQMREKGKSYFCMPMYSFNEKAPEKQLDEMKAISNYMEDFYNDFTAENKGTVYFIESKYEIDDKKGITTITFRGEITDKETGELVPFEKVMNFASIVTKSIDNPIPSETNYFNEE